MICSTALVLTALRLVASSPVPEVELAALPRDLEEPAATAAALQRRYVCDTINYAVEAIGTSKSKIIYSVSATVTANEVCGVLARRGIGGIGTQDCGGIRNVMTVGFLPLFTATGSSSEEAPEEDTDEKRCSLPASTNPSLASNLHSFVASDQFAAFSHSVVFELDPVSLDPSKPMLQHALVAGVTDGNTTVDMIFADFGNGEGHVRLQAPNGNWTASSSEGAGSRRVMSRSEHDGPGFKISYTSRQKTLLNQQHQQNSADALSFDWATRADINEIGDYTGSQETQHYSNFYFRVIAEIDSYGLNYESVDYPYGGMAQFL